MANAPGKPAGGSKAKAEKTIVRAQLDPSLGQKALNQAMRNLRDRPRILRSISAYAVRWEKLVFSTKGAVTGNRWERRADGTPARNVATGALKKALTGAPRQMKASVQVRGPEYGLALARGRWGPNSRPAKSDKTRKDGKPFAIAGKKGWGGTMPHRNPMPRPPKKQVQILTQELLGITLPKG